MDTWPISTITHEGWAFIGIPDRLGDGGPYRPDSGFPTLEEIAGDEWLAEILSGLLPFERAGQSLEPSIDPGAVRIRLGGISKRCGR